MQFNKPDVATVPFIKFVKDNAAAVREAMALEIQAANDADEATRTRLAPKTYAEATEILEATAAETSEEIDGWLLSCVHAVSRGNDPPYRRFDEFGKVLLCLAIDQLKPLIPQLVEPGDVMTKAAREKKVADLTKKAEKARAKIADLIPADVDFQKVKDVVNFWRHIQSLCDEAVDLFGASLDNGNPFRDCYDKLGIATAIPQNGRYEAVEFARVEFFYVDFR